MWRLSNADLVVSKGEYKQQGIFFIIMAWPFIGLFYNLYSFIIIFFEFVHSYSFCRILLHPQKTILKSDRLGSCYAYFISPSIAFNIIKGVKYKHLTSKIVNDFVDQNSIDSRDVQKTLDNCGISRRGYT